MLAEFGDPDGPGFYDTSASHETPVARPRDLHDGATPSGNSVGTDVLLRLGAMTGNEDYAGRASELLRTMASTMREHPLAAGRYLSAVDFYLGPVKEVALAGDRESRELQALLDALYDQFEPNLIAGTLTRNKATWRSACHSCKIAHRRKDARLPTSASTSRVCLQCTNLTRCSGSSAREPALAGEISEHARSVSRIAR